MTDEKPFFKCVVIFSYAANCLRSKRSAETSAKQVQLAQAVLTFKELNSLSFNVELATTDAQITQGLMYRKELRPNDGMLFMFGDSKIRTFWMKNTYIPLDIIFIDENWRIVHIATDAKPLSVSIISSKYPAHYVLEINAGQSSRLGIKVGMTAMMSCEN